MKMTRAEWRALARRAWKLAHSGNTIQAIKLLRAETNCGLTEAYRAIQRLQAIKEPE